MVWGARGWKIVALLSVPLLLAHCTSHPKHNPGSTSPSVVVRNEGSSSSAKRQIAPGVKPMQMSVDGIELEDTVDAFCTEINAIFKNHDFSNTSWTKHANCLFPRLSLVWRMHSQEATSKEIEADPDSALVYKYLLGNDERVQSTLTSLGTLMCWARLDRVWFAIFDNPTNANMVDWGLCPLAHLPYVADSSNVFCPHHGISFTFPNHEARPTYDELSVQLISGHFTRQHRLRMDPIFRTYPVTAVKKGEVVGDIGCGLGGDSLTMSELVGDKGRVIAVDINSHVLDFLKYVLKMRAITNVVPVQASVEDPSLKIESLDKVFMIDIVEQIIDIKNEQDERGSTKGQRYLRKIVDSLKYDGKLIIVGKQTQKMVEQDAKKLVDIFDEFGMKCFDVHRFNTHGTNRYALTLVKETPIQED